MGDRVREIRKQRGLTQEQLAEKVDITLKLKNLRLDVKLFVTQLKQKCPVKQVNIKLVEVLDVSSDYLLRDSVSTRNLYGDKQIGSKLERLTPKQRVALEALIDTYIEYLD